MALEPPIRDALRYPFSSAVAILAMVVSLNWWGGGGWATPLIGSGSLLSEPWILVTSTLPHVNPAHLLFNLMWWWMFGSQIERVWGMARASAIFAYLAAISSAAEIALSSSGVGLSGVVYGLCTLLWVVQDHVPRIGRVVTRQTLNLFGAWFVLCIVLTVTNVMPIANVAHAAGALAGWVLGKLIVERESRRAWFLAALGMAVCIAAGATIARPWVNFSREFRDNGFKGSVALAEGRYDQAATLLEAAVRETPTDPGLLMNLGIAYQSTNRPHDALDLYRKAVKLDELLRDRLAPAIASIINHDAAAAAARGDIDGARSLAEEALRWVNDDPYARELLQWVDSVEKARKAEIEREK